MYKTTSKVSSNSLSIFSRSFSTYADALYTHLDDRGIEKVWLAKKITPTGQKVASTQEKISRWKREGSKPSSEVRELIHEILDVSIVMESDGQWKIRSRTKESLDKKERAENLVNSYVSRKLDKEVSDKEREILIEYLQEQAESLSKGLRRLSELYQNRDRDD